MTSGTRRLLLTTVMIGTMLGASACRESEQGRPLFEQKGVYQGEADEALSEERVQELRSRADGQKF